MTPDYGCTETGKRRYLTSADAHAAVVGTKRRGHRVRPYRCDHCHGWHLTHYLQEVRPKSRARTIPRPLR
ncbi:MAG: hypothetical protein GAK28_00610 [Luteibacter sp.]|nr:MAG: hypothetical protein GAK28_00610 [Luteibacter sp.]